jgi:steroid 5-alpha reductase family enzyme
MTAVLAIGGATIAAFVVLWLISLPLRNASIVDPFWGMGFLLATVLAAAWSQSLGWRAWLLVALVTIWALRLSGYLLWRNAGHGEDRRYRAMRDHHGERFWWVSLFTVFLLQAAILWVLSLTVTVPILFPVAAEFHWLDAVGLLLWAVGWLFETVGDWQLARFQRQAGNAQRVMDRGLWRYTRHPNYFGECCLWWGLYCIAAAGGAAWTIFNPILLTVLLLRVSGVSLLEQTITDRRPDYADYKARTSAFIPWPPREVHERDPNSVATL